MSLKSPLLTLPGELRNIIYRAIAMKDIKVCLITGSRIDISHPLVLVCKQIQSEFVPILEEAHPGVASGLVPRTVHRFLLDLDSITYRKLSAKMIVVSKHAAEYDIKDVQVRYVNANAA